MKAVVSWPSQFSVPGIIRALGLSVATINQSSTSRSNTLNVCIATNKVRKIGQKPGAPPARWCRSTTATTRTPAEHEKGRDGGDPSVSFGFGAHRPIAFSDFRRGVVDPDFRVPAKGDENHGCHHQADDGAVKQRRVENVNRRHVPHDLCAASQRSAICFAIGSASARETDLSSMPHSAGRPAVPQQLGCFE